MRSMSCKLSIFTYILLFKPISDGVIDLQFIWMINLEFKKI